jgi:hypothetical protein
MCLCVYVCVGMCVSVCVGMYVCVCVYVCMYTVYVFVGDPDGSADVDDITHTLLGTLVHSWLSVL